MAWSNCFWLFTLRTPFLFIVGSVLTGCVATTGTKATMTGTDLGQIKKAGVFVESPHPISVRVSRDNMTNTGAALFGLVGAAVEAGYKSSQDSGHADTLLTAVGKFDPAHESAVALRDRFAAAHVFPTVAIVASDNRREAESVGFDALFQQTIEEWGLRLCGGEDRVRVELDVHSRLVTLPEGTVKWERDELMIDGACRPISEFQADPELLRSSLKSAIETLAGRTVNEIAFP